MTTAGRGIINVHRMPQFRATSWPSATGLLLAFACLSLVSGQSRTSTQEIARAQQELNNGNYARAVVLAKLNVDSPAQDLTNLSALEIIFKSQIAQQSYGEASITLERCFRTLSSNRSGPLEKARVHLLASDLYRGERKFPQAFREAKKAIDIVARSIDINAAYHLSIGRTMFTSGYDLSAIIWLEKAEKLFEAKPSSEGQLDAYRFLSLAWASKMNYPAALKYSDRFAFAAGSSPFKYKYRQSLFESGTLLSSIGQTRKAFAAREKGLQLSLENKNTYQARNFLAALLLDSLYVADVTRAEIYLRQLKDLDQDGSFSFESNLGSAVIAGLTGQPDISRNLFAELGSRENTSPYILPSWNITIAENNKQWNQVLEYNEALLKLTLGRNFREDLPGIYFSFATALFNLRQNERSLEYLDKTLSHIEEIRSSENKSLSLGLSETYHKAYRLLAQLKLEQPRVAFELSDFLKARLLKDKINDSPVTQSLSILPETRRKLETLSKALIDNPNVAAEIDKLESSFTTATPELSIPKPDLSGLDSILDLAGKAIVSYLFTLDGRLLVFVWEKDEPVRAAYLATSESDLEAIVKAADQKIKHRIFYKRDGEELFNKLLKPLNVSARHLIIVPDKFLWKVPFQALSADGERYLIEDKIISYTPSIAILLDQLKAPRPRRQTLQAFANHSFGDQILRHVNEEALNVAGLFNSRPSLNATVQDFRRTSDQADILHFSMHAQVDNDNPLDSFLAFKQAGANRGRLTVNDILSSKLKNGSLVFLASCDTNNVLSGEGLVSLAWGMMGAGATTVISAHWEANDKMTETFSRAFYKYYKEGLPAVGALQRASMDMIKDKSNNLHEPYYWADFTLTGDFR